MYSNVMEVVCIKSNINKICYHINFLIELLCMHLRFYVPSESFIQIKFGTIYTIKKKRKKKKHLHVMLYTKRKRKRKGGGGRQWWTKIFSSEFKLKINK